MNNYLIEERQIEQEAQVLRENQFIQTPEDSVQKVCSQDFRIINKKLSPFRFLFMDKP